jgi:DNA-binding NarL/FixJ family response regulator
MRTDRRVVARLGVLVLLDVRMPGMNGVHVAKRLHAEHPDLVVLISVDEGSSLPPELSSCGAAELARKQDLGPALLRRLWNSHGPHASTAR